MYKKARPSKEWLYQAYVVEKRSTESIAESFSVNAESVRKWLIKYGIPRRSHSESLMVDSKMPSREWLEEAYVIQGKTTKMIGEERGTPAETVITWLKRYGIERRSSYESLVISGGKLGGWNRIEMPPKEQICDSYVVRRNSTVDMAKEFGVSPSTALHWLKASDIPVRTYSECNKVQGDHLNEEWLIDQYLIQKKTMQDIASLAGVSKKTIARIMTGFGLSRRNRSEAFRGNPRRSGINNPMWKGGLTPHGRKLRYSAEYLEACRRVRKRDKSCLLCLSKGINTKGEMHHVHHIEPMSEAMLLVFDIGNMILLCEPCHLSMRGEEKRWKKRLFKLVKESEARLHSKVDTQAEHSTLNPILTSGGKSDEHP